MRCRSPLFTVLAVGSLVAACFPAHAGAQSAGTHASTPAELRPPADSDFDALRARLAPGGVGLRPQSTRGWYDISLPFGINYSSATRSVMVPLDEKREWGVGVILNVNPPQGLEVMSAPALGLQPKRTPGILLQKKF